MAAPRKTPRVPPLEPGDHLTRDEFERRYDAMPGLKKAELIEGVVYLPSPIRQPRLSSPRVDLIGWLGSYRVYTPGVEGGVNCTVRLDPNNEPQPDTLLLIEPDYGGQVRISDDDLIVGAPELMADVAAREAADLETKLRVFRRNGVREYLVWRVLDQAIDWFILRQGNYDSLPPGADGVYRSEVFPGLWLDAAALVRRDLAAVLRVLQQGLASPEHAAFVARLRQAGAAGNP